MMTMTEKRRAVEPRQSKVSDLARRLLGQMTVRGNVLLKHPRKLERGEYEELTKVLDALGGKWRGGKTQGHVFGDGVDVAALIQDVLAGGTYVDPKANHLFETPRPLAIALVGLADVKAGEHVCEPSAGKGRIATALREAGGIVWCVELLPWNVKHLREAGFDRVRQGDFLTFSLADIVGSEGPKAGFAKIVMNPPFSAHSAYDDIDHIMHAWGLLAPGGLLIAVAAAGVQFREDRRTKEFRKFVADHGGHIAELAGDSFRSEGTSVRTCVVTLLRGDGQEVRRG